VTAAQAHAAAKRGHLRDLGLPTMFGAVVLLVSATLLLGANISALRGNLAQVAHAQQVVNKIAELETGLLGEEMIVRGYALTGDASFLRMQRTGAQKREAAQNELTRLMAAEPQRADQVRRVMDDIARHVEIFGNLAGNGPDKAGIVARAIVDPSVRDNMRRVRTGLRQLRANELDDLGARQREITEQLGRAFLLAIGIIITAFVLGGIGIWAAQLHHPQKH
jgi:CHASE3 domain sensor protein